MTVGAALAFALNSSRSINLLGINWLICEIGQYHLCCL